MATYFLINTTSVGATKIFAGDLVNDAVEDVNAIRSAGGLLWPSGDPTIAAAAAKAVSARINKGASEAEVNAIMQQAVDAVQLADGGSVAWRTASNWFINATTGLDTNSGTVLSEPLKTFAELARRWGTFQTLTPVLTPGIINTVVVNLLTDLPASDRIQFKVGLAGGVSILIKGATPTTIATGTVGVVIAKDRATNQSLDVDFGVAVAPFRIDGATPARILNNTTGGVCHVMKAISANVARLSEPITPFVAVPAALFPGQAITNANRPAVLTTAGQTWTAQGLTTVSVGDVEFLANLAGPGTSCLAFADLNIRRDVGDNPAWFIAGGAIKIVFFYGCIIQRTYNVQTETFGCYSVHRGLNGDGESWRPMACGIFSTITMNSQGVFVELDTIFQGGGALGGNGISVINGAVKIGTAAVFDVAGGGPNNPTGAGVYVSAGSDYQLGGPAVGADITHALWGLGNVGPGIEVGPGGTFLTITNSPTITGTGGDFRLDGATDSRAWDETAGAGAGAWTLLIANTWANFVATIGAGGLGSAAMNVGKKCLIAVGL